MLGTNRAGDSVAPSVTLEQVATAVRWVAPVPIADGMAWVEVLE